MSASIDFIHDEQVIDAVLAEFRRNLPAAWTSGRSTIYKLKELEFGDLRDYSMTPEETLRSLMPMMLVRSDGNAWNAGEGGMGGKMMVDYPVRIVYAFTDAQRRDATTTRKTISPERTRTQRAKVINRALFTDPLRRLNGPTLTASDGLTATVHDVEYGGLQMRGVEDFALLPGGFYALGIDIVVQTFTQ